LEAEPPADAAAPTIYQVNPSGEAEPIEGPEGPEGPEGEPGPEGEEGPEGEPGPEGEEGPEGKQGKEGPEGKQGKEGPEGKGAGVLFATPITWQVQRIEWAKSAATQLYKFLSCPFQPTHVSFYAFQNGSTAAPLNTSPAENNRCRGQNVPMATPITGNALRPPVQRGQLNLVQVPIMPGEILCRFTRTALAAEKGLTIIYVVFWGLESVFGDGAGGGSGIGSVKETAGTLTGVTTSFFRGLGQKFWAGFYSRSSGELPTKRGWTDLFSEKVEISAGVFGTAGVQILISTRKQQEEGLVVPTAEWVFPNTVPDVNENRLIYVEGAG
jgi:hypothetical protein